jgi:DNA-binding beta-propeller fold protein YncE
MSLRQRITICRVLFFFLPLLVLMLLQSYAVGDESISEQFKRGVYHFNRKEYEASIEYFRGALGRAPGDRRARYFLALAYFKAGFEENALFELNTIIENSGQDPVLENFVSYLYKKQLFFKADRMDEGYSTGMEIRGNSIGKYILSRVTGIDVDQSGALYICGFGSKLALKVSSEGKPLFAFTSPKVDHGRLYDIAVGNGVVYISDYTNDTVYRYTPEGKYLGQIGSSGLEEGQFYGPTSITLDEAGNLYIVDSGNMRVQKFSGDGRLLLSFGKEGKAEGEFNHPSGIAVDSAGYIYIADRGKRTIGMYDKSGNFLSLLKGEELIEPYGLTCTDDNRLIVSDSSRIVFYDITHSVWSELKTERQIERIVDVQQDSLGQLYACDFDRDEVIQLVSSSEKYRNLNVLFSRVDTSNYPTLVYYATVLSTDGLPIYGLGASHFLLRIGEGVVGRVDLSFTDVRESKLNTVVLVDKSLAMKKHEPDIDRYLRGFFNSMSTVDEVAVIGFDDAPRILSPFTSSKLAAMNAVLHPDYREGRAFDRAFRRGIDLLNKQFHKKAVIFITDGSMGADSFLTYSFESCKNYAANNGIPVYVLSFGGKKDPTLDYFARSTGGRFYDVIHSNEFVYLYDTITSYRSPEYVIYFSDVYDSSLGGLYIDAEVEVDYNGRIGKNRLGFIYP